MSPMGSKIARYQQYAMHAQEIQRERQIAALPGPSFCVGRDPDTGWRHWQGLDGEITTKRFTGDYQPVIGLDLRREVVGR